MCTHTPTRGEQDQMLPLSKAMLDYYRQPAWQQLVDEFSNTAGVFWVEPVETLLSEDDWAVAVEVADIDTRVGRDVVAA